MKEFTTSAIIDAGSKSRVFHIRLEEIPYAKVRTGLKYNTRNLRASYQMPGSFHVVFPLVEMEIGKYIPGGFIETDRKNLPGFYQICVPDEALALAGFAEIHIGGAKNMIPLKIQIELIDAAPRPYVLQEGAGRSEGLSNLEDLRILKEAATAANKISEDDFNEWMTDRWNEYSKAGINQDSRGIEEFVKDFKEKFPEGVKIL